MIVADTSFLLSLYGNDPNTAQATAKFRLLPTPIQIHAFNDLEFENAVRNLVFRQKIAPDVAALWQSAHRADKVAAKLSESNQDPATVLVEAMRISAAHTETIGSRAYDILHVAAAKALGATEFLSLDSNQRKLAAAEGLLVGP